MFTLSIFVPYIHNVQHTFILSYYAKELVKGLLNLGVGMLCLGFKLDVCSASMLF
jgi:hypothetical protein